MFKSRKFVIGYAIAVFAVVFLITFVSVCSIAQFEVTYEIRGMHAAAESIQTRLDEEYRGKSYLFFKRADAAAVVAEESGGYMEVTAFSKRFPNKVILSVREKPEVFSFGVEENGHTRYVVVADDGTVLAVREEGGAGVKIAGFTFAVPAAGSAFSVTAEQAPAYEALRTVFSVAEEKLGSFRGNVTAVTYRNDFAGLAYSASLFVLEMKEGVRVWIQQPETNTEAKVRAALGVYLGELTKADGTPISDEERTYGSIVVYASGTAVYTERETPGSASAA